MRISTSLVISFLMLALSVTGANARIQIEGVYAFGEETSASDRLCSITKEAAIAAVEATLRANRIPLLSSEDSYGNISAYVNFTSLDYSDSACAVSWSLEFRIWGSGKYLQYDRPLRGNVKLCGGGGILSGSRVSLSPRIREKYQTATEICISAVETADE
jgi:hypothetical protein